MAWYAAAASEKGGVPGWRASSALLSVTARATRWRQGFSWLVAQASERTTRRRSCPVRGGTACSRGLRSTAYAKPIATGAAVSAGVPLAGGTGIALGASTPLQTGASPPSRAASGLCVAESGHQESS